MESTTHDSSAPKDSLVSISALSPTTLADRKDYIVSDDKADPLPDIPVEQHDQIEPTVAPAPSRKRFVLSSNRLLSLDLLRGLAIFLMITCNSQSGSEVFDILEHPDWIGITIADTIFPGFLFISGVAIPLAMRGPSLTDPQYNPQQPGKFYLRQGLRVFKRALSIMCLGYVLALYGLVQLSYGGDKFRWPGVLQRIGFCYGIVAWMHLLVLYRGSKPAKPVSIAYLQPGTTTRSPDTPPRNNNDETKRSQVVANSPWPWVLQVSLPYWLPVGCLVIWLIATYTVKVEGCPEKAMIRDPACSPQAYFDLKIFGTNHMYRHKNFDPEGSLSTLTSILNVWFGWFIGCSVREFNAQIKQIRADFKARRVAEATVDTTEHGHEEAEATLQDQVMEQEMVVRTYMTLLGEWFWWGILWMFIGWLFSLGLPLSKPSWTATFAVLTSGISQTALAVLFFKFDAQTQIKQLNRLHKDHQTLASPLNGGTVIVDPEHGIVDSHGHQTSKLLDIYYFVDHFFRHWFRYGINLVLGTMGRNAILIYMCAEIVTGSAYFITVPAASEPGGRKSLWSAAFDETWGKLDIGGWGSLFFSLGFVFFHVCLAIFLDHKKWYFKV
ncbi:hypothetical protein BG004_005684 [Podila humilis]|nr:hypothetical protein BG004_005684 [Podila humilis]